MATSSTFLLPFELLISFPGHEVKTAKRQPKGLCLVIFSTINNGSKPILKMSLLLGLTGAGTYPMPLTVTNLATIPLKQTDMNMGDTKGVQMDLKLFGEKSKLQR